VALGAKPFLQIQVFVAKHAAVPEDMVGVVTTVPAYIVSHSAKSIFLRIKQSKHMSAFKYTADHVWVRNDADGVVEVGITSFAQESLGDIVFIELPKVDSHMKQGEEAAVIESVKVASALIMPVTGTIIEVNKALEAEPAIANVDPLEAGWFFRMRLEQPDEIKGMMDENSYNRFVGKTQ
jgi:glycine cleavage system H protein